MTVLTIDPAAAAINEARDTTFCEGLFTALREATGDGIGITRESFGAGESLALELIEKAATGAGLTSERDAGGNLVVTLPGSEPDLPCLACGSHLDSVPQGGNYDGGTGVIAGLAILAGLKRSGFRPRRTIKLFGLRGEESAWFGKAYMGSSALFGRLSKDGCWPIACATSARTSTASRAASRCWILTRSPPGSNCISNRDRSWSHAICRSES
jgi:N-carbamoyl-L-amino-acid hydrolase